MMESIKLSPWAILFAGAALQGLFVAAILFFTQKGNARANKLLAALILVFTYTRFQAFVNITEAYRLWPHLLHTATPLWFILAPLYYFYVKTLLGQSTRWNIFSVIHVLPFAVILIDMTLFFTLPAEAKLAMVSSVNRPAGVGIIRFLHVLVYGIQNVIYLVICIRKLQQQEAVPDRAAEALKPAHVSWLKFLFTLMVLYAFFDVLMTALHFLRKTPFIEMDYFPMAVFTVLVYAIGYIGMQQPEKLFPPQLRIRKTALPRDWTPMDARRIVEQLYKVMETQKPYLNCNLKYSDLAAKLGISVRLLSRIMNEEMGQNFNDFVNAYRIKEVQKQLLNEENGEHTLLAVALDAGFNSKTSFNRIFKNHTGMTPTQFLQAHKQNGA